ncbi:fatty acyl-AMP ligase [Pendulispora albinea]|uniref:Fatty acyl-AMP ligase n=1 Tax=Pendulispora albinea TaxID=2741071 RepID=A0ABZ2LZS2_9BACT
MTPPLAKTLIERLFWRNEHAPDEFVFAYLEDGEREAGRLTYGELTRSARAVAAALKQHARPGDRAILLYPSGLDFIVAFFGCLLARIVAVPTYPPDPSRLARSLERLASVTDDAEPALVLGPRSLLEAMSPLRDAFASLGAARWLETDTLSAAEDHASPSPADLPRPEDIAFLQYTSGSTSAPRGVAITHGNLVANAILASDSLFLAGATVVSWLPLYHDMGLMGCILYPVFTGYRSILMSPVDFLRRPVRWLRAISNYRATTTVAPDFAFALCTRRVRAEERRTLDLSALRVAINGAEPVRPETIAGFSSAFAEAGFDESAFLPAYGLAESTLYVAGGCARRPPTRLHLDAKALSAGDVAPVREASASTCTLIGCNRLPDAPHAPRIAIVDPATHARCPPGRVGEIWVSGTSVASGYFERKDATRETFGARIQGETHPAYAYLRTGDLGFLHEGELFVSGRAKDVIIVHGACHYPQDIERTAEAAHPALRSGGSAAFSLEAQGEEQVGIVLEIARELDGAPDWESVRAAVREAVLERHGIPVAAVALLQPSTLLKTSSGKVQRRACKEAFAKGTLELVPEPDAPR